ncbi:glycosyltransferase [Olivibacter jilunii]|uniref:glycosyltransferase n=1 Tax=Olivibacter jilunii TaxID=985016 RepID=UPI003F17462E
MKEEKVLIVDFMITGHHSEYIDHLLTYLQQRGDARQYIFLTHPDFASTFPAIANKTAYPDGAKLETITLEEWNNFQKKNLLGKSFYGLQLVSKYAEEFNSRRVLLLYFNFFQFALLFVRPKFTISGILFLQFYRMSKKGLKNRLKYHRKYWTTKLLMLNKKIKRIYVLNDEGTVAYLNQTFKVSTFKMLPDPIPQLSPLVDFNVYQHYHIATNKQILLHIGALDERKGTFEFLRAAAYISKGIQQNLVFLLVGKGNKERLSEEIEKVEKLTNVQIIWDNQFISNEMMKALFDQCHAVVIPYKNPEASSGILGHAAAANKMVITTGKGLLKEIVSKYGLGLLIEEVSPELIARKIDESIKGHVEVKRAREFVLNRTPRVFAEDLLRLS